MNKIAINSWLYENLRPKEVVKKIADLGISGVEFSGKALTKLNYKDLKELQDELDRFKIEVSAINAAVDLVPYIGGNVSSSLPDFLEETRNFLKKCIDLAHKLKSNYVIVSGGRKADNYQSLEEAWSVARESYQIIAGYALPLKVDILLESFPPAAHRTFGSSQLLIKMIWEVNRVNFKASIDAGHLLFLNENLMETAELIAPYLRYVHLDNTYFIPGQAFLDQHLPLSKGTINKQDFRELLKILRRRGYQNYYALNITSSGNPDIAAKESIDFLRSLIR